MEHIEARIDLPAEPSVVWKQLIDTASMASWNPFITSMSGVLAVGERLQVRIAPAGGRALTFKPRVTIVQPDQRLEWLGTMGIPGLFDGRHSFTLIPLEQGRTRLVQAETFSGALIPFTGKLLQRTEAGFQAMNTALLTRLKVAAVKVSGTEGVDLASIHAPERAVTIDGPPVGFLQNDRNESVDGSTPQDPILDNTANIRLNTSAPRPPDRSSGAPRPHQYPDRDKDRRTPDPRNNQSISGSTNQREVNAMSRRMVAIIVGALFVVQMITAVIGNSLIQSFGDGGTATAPPTIGVLLMLCSGLAVVGIGLLMYPVLKTVKRELALWYPILRIVEFIVSTVGGIYLLTQLHVVPNQMLWVYIPTGLGGLVLCYLLYVSRLVPRPIAVTGLFGYLLLSLGVLLDLLGVVDMNAGPGQLILLPGGLFEVVLLPVWLIAKGFNSPSPRGQLKPYAVTP